MSRHAEIEIQDAKGERWQLALELLRDGKRVNIAGVILQRSKAGDWSADVPLAGTSENPDEAIVWARSVLRGFLSSSEQLHNLIAGSPVAFRAVDDYGMGMTLVKEFPAAPL